MTELSEVERAVRREEAFVRHHTPATLERIGIQLRSIAGRQLRQDTRFKAIFRDFDALHGAMEQQRARLEAIEAKLDQLLATRRGR